jgi:hypothetical protein
MKIESPAALRFIIDDDLYLLDKDKIAATISAPSVIETPSPAFKYLGGNKKNFLITVHYTGKEFMDDSHFTALENILKRKGLAIDDVAILNIANHTAGTFEQLTDYFKPEKLLIMGEMALPQYLEPPLINQPTRLNHCLLLYSFSFDGMMSSNENKKTFWDQMKNL